MLRSILFEQKDEQRMPQAVLLVQATETTMRQPKFVSVSYIHTHLDTRVFNSNTHSENSEHMKQISHKSSLNIYCEQKKINDDTQI